MSAALFGRFLELSLATEDPLISFSFYEQLGFSTCPVGDAWPHRYGVLGDGRIHLGLHERALDSPAAAFVLPQLVRARARLLAAGFAPEHEHLGEESLHTLHLRDPAGHLVILQEARSFSPAGGPATSSRCGRFLHLSLPQANLALARLFWESGGLVALPEEAQPYPHVPLVADQFTLAFHSPALCRDALLVFEHPQPQQLQQAVREPFQPARRLPGITGEYCLLQAPEGTLLLCTQPAER